MDWFAAKFPLVHYGVQGLLVSPIVTPTGQKLKSLLCTMVHNTGRWCTTQVDGAPCSSVLLQWCTIGINPGINSGIIPLLLGIRIGIKHLKNSWNGDRNQRSVDNVGILPESEWESSFFMQLGIGIKYFRNRASQLCMGRMIQTCWTGHEQNYKCFFSCYHNIYH